MQNGVGKWGWGWIPSNANTSAEDKVDEATRTYRCRTIQAAIVGC